MAIERNLSSPGPSPAASCGVFRRSAATPASRRSPPSGLRRVHRRLPDRSSPATTSTSRPSRTRRPQQHHDHADNGRVDAGPGPEPAGSRSWVRLTVHLAVALTRDALRPRGARWPAALSRPARNVAPAPHPARGGRHRCLLRRQRRTPPGHVGRAAGPGPTRLDPLRRGHGGEPPHRGAPAGRADLVKDLPRSVKSA
jgi:hypothetical protein